MPLDLNMIIIYAFMALILILVGVSITFFVKSIKAKIAYETETLPDIFEDEEEALILPDIEESGFSNLSSNNEGFESSSSEILDDIYENRRSE